MYTVYLTVVKRNACTGNPIKVKTGSEYRKREACEPHLLCTQTGRLSTFRENYSRAAVSEDAGVKRDRQIASDISPGPITSSDTHVHVCCVFSAHKGTPYLGDINTPASEHKIDR